MEITALSVTEKAEVFKGIPALSSVGSQMEEFLSYADKIVPTDVKYQLVQWVRLKSVCKN